MITDAITEIWIDISKVYEYFEPFIDHWTWSTSKRKSPPPRDEHVNWHALSRRIHVKCTYWVNTIMYLLTLIIDQSQDVTNMMVIYHHSDRSSLLWRISYAHVQSFALNNVIQFCQDTHIPGEYIINIACYLLTKAHEEIMAVIKQVRHKYLLFPLFFCL